MRRQNLLKIDDALLRAARLLGLVWLLGALVALAIASKANEGLGARVALVAICGSAPLGLLLSGLALRRRERRAWALHRLVDDHVEIPASDLIRDSDFTATTLARAIRDLNNAGAAFLVWDRKNDVVQDGRLRSARIQVEDCRSCGAKVMLTVCLGDLAAARCPYCSHALGAERLTEERARVIDELGAGASRAVGDAPSTFSPVTFMLLLLTFWPLAVGYAIWHWRAGQPAET